MDITFRQLQLFRALVTTGSVSGAAREADVTQPTASIHLRELAEEIGLPLYEVIGRTVHLTEAGRELAATARAVQDEWETFSQKVAALKGAERGKLRVAVVSTAKYFVPRLLGEFCAAHPGIDVALEVLNRDGVIARLRDNLDDLYVMSRPPTDLALEDRILLPNPLLLIAPKSHPLVRRKRIEIKALAGERFIFREEGSGTRLATDAFFKSQRFQPKVRLTLGSNEAIKEAVAGGLGLAVISSHALRHAPTPGLTVLDVVGFPVSSQWHIVYPSGRRLSPIAKIFEAHLVRHSAEIARALKT
ncbi:MAG: LysR family transcriptional regulator [Verrucomicrobia bacterium]|nr:LysR family transcriptional regulator [Verrucomicrobiota bacterium]